MRKESNIPSPKGRAISGGASSAPSFRPRHLSAEALRHFKRFHDNWRALGPRARIKHYVRQSDYDRRKQNFVAEQREMAPGLVHAWGIEDFEGRVQVYEDLDSKGSLPIEARESGSKLWSDIAREGSAGPLLVTAYEIARLFRDTEPDEVRTAEGRDLVAQDFVYNARRFAQHCRANNTRVLVAYDDQFYWFDFTAEGTEGEEAIRLFSEFARHAGAEARTIRVRLQTARTRASERGKYIGGTARIGHYALPPGTPAAITGARFHHPEQLLYLPHALVVARWWRVALMPQMDNFPRILRYARGQTRRFLETGGAEGEDFRFHPFPEHLHEYCLGASALRRMTCHTDKEGYCECAPGRIWGVERHYVWRDTLLDENERVYHEPLPWAECAPIFPTTHMMPALLTNPIYLGDRIQNEEALTQHGLFRYIDREAVSVDDEETALRELRARAANVVNNGYHPHMRLVRGHDPRASAEDIAEAVESGRINEVAGGTEDALSPEAVWRPEEADFWELCRKFCPIDMRLWRDSGYSPEALVLNRDCIIVRGRPVAASSRSPYSGVWFCLRHGFEEVETPTGQRIMAPSRRNPLFHTIHRKADKLNPHYKRLVVRCEGDRKRDGISRACSEWGGQDTCMNVLGHYIQGHLTALASNPEGRVLFTSLFAPQSDPDEVERMHAEHRRLLEQYEDRQNDILLREDSVLEIRGRLKKGKSDDPALDAQRVTRLERQIATMEEERVYLKSEMNRLEQILATPVREDLIATFDDWAYHWHAKSQNQEHVIEANDMVRGMLNWIGMLVVSASDVRETLLAVRWWHGRTEYLLSWRGRSPHDPVFAPADDKWLLANYTRVDRLLIEQMDKRFWKKGVTMVQVARHCRDDLGLHRAGSRGRFRGGSINLHREWEARHEHFIDRKGNQAILYGVLDAHPLKAKSMEVFGHDGGFLRTMDLPKDVMARLRKMVKTHAPRLP